MIRPAHYPASSNALDAAAAQRMVRVTHPFHPWSGREFVFVAVRQTWSQDRVFFLDADGRQHSLPVGWTDAAGPDVFVTVAAGRCPFRVADLPALARLAEVCRAAPPGPGGKAESAAVVRRIMPGSMCIRV